MSTGHWTTFDSPLGTLTLVGGPHGLSALHFPEHDAKLDEGERAPELFADAVRALDEYFAGRRERFDIALDLRGTALQRAVWRQLVAIPYASTTTYGALARAVGRPTAVRAVAGAVGRTPVPIVVPCHRVVAGDGALTGYRGGLERKRALLDLEAASAPARSRPGEPALR